MGILKRRLRQEEDDQEFGRDEEMAANELSDDSTTSEEESEDGESLIEGDTSDHQNEDAVAGSDKAHAKTKVMILASRGINARQRHLLDDFCLLLPHAKKESKFDTKRDLFALNELAELNGCNHILFFESRRPQELFVWASKSPSGPSVRFHVQNVHTLEELNLAGNCMKNTRPILTFDPVFGQTAHGQVMKGLLESIFGVPKDHRKTRPYVDRVMHFAWGDDRIWVRNYQIKEGATEEQSIEGLNLVEIGPRLLLHPVRVMDGSLSGRTSWQNPNYVPASVMRESTRMASAHKRKQKSISNNASYMRKKNAALPDNELDHVFD